MQVGRNKASGKRRHGCLAAAAADGCGSAAEKRECKKDCLTCEPAQYRTCRSAGACRSGETRRRTAGDIIGVFAVSSSGCMQRGAEKRECDNDYLTCGPAQHMTDSILQQQVGRDMQVGRGDTVEKNMAAAAAAAADRCGRERGSGRSGRSGQHLVSDGP